VIEVATVKEEEKGMMSFFYQETQKSRSL